MISKIIYDIQRSSLCTVATNCMNLAVPVLNEAETLRRRARPGKKVRIAVAMATNGKGKARRFVPKLSPRLSPPPLARVRYGPAAARNLCKHDFDYLYMPSWAIRTHFTVCILAVDAHMISRPTAMQRTQLSSGERQHRPSNNHH